MERKRRLVDDAFRDGNGMGRLEDDGKGHHLLGKKRILVDHVYGDGNGMGRLEDDGKGHHLPGKKRRLVDHVYGDGNGMGRLEDDGKGHHLPGKKRRLEESNFDRLPDDIVASIFDRLGWKDASNTCLVSRRYHHILKTCVMYKKKLEFVVDREASSCFEFVKSVNNVLYIHEGQKVDSLRIAFKSVWKHKELKDEIHSWMQDSLNNWVAFGRNKSVQSLDIDTYYSSYDYLLPALQFPTFEGFDKLTSLSLMTVHVDDAVLEQGLKSHLVNLESLRIGQMAHLKEVVINESPPKLKKLEIYWCRLLRSVDIVSAPNLECFICPCNGREAVILKFQDVPKLSDVRLGGVAISHNSLSELSKNARMLDKLQLHSISCIPHRTVHPRFDMFDKLTSLSLQSAPIRDADLKYLVNLESLQIERSESLKMVVVALPKLKTLEIRNCCQIRSINIDSAPNLQCFKYQHEGRGQGVVHFKHVPKLSDLYFDHIGGMCLNYLAEQLPKVGMTLEKLELVMAPNCRNPEHAECMTYPKHFPLLGNLKELTCHIVMDEKTPIRLLGFTHLLAACPKLRKLTVDYRGSRNDEGWGSDLIKARHIAGTLLSQRA